jgi:hypothetical protein
MKTSKIFLASLFMVSVVSVSLNSCQKIADISDVSEDNAIAESQTNDAMKVVESAAKEEDLEGSNKNSPFSLIYGSCATLTVTPAWPDPTFPKTLVIDFGTGGCVGDDGKTRKGVITVVMTGKYRDMGSEMTIETDNYEVNDYLVDLSKTVENMGLNTDNQTYFSIHAEANITTPENETITWTSDRTRTWVEGESTSYSSDGEAGILDDVYLISGTASGVNREGRAYTVQSTKDLRVELSCKWIVEGILEITPEDLQSASIDFGNGTCDDEAVVMIGNKTKTITLK